MAGPFGPDLDFTSLAQLPNVYRQGQDRATTQEAMAQYQQTGDPRALIQSGNMTLANLGMNALHQQQLAQRQAAQDQLQRDRYVIDDKRADRRDAQTEKYQAAQTAISNRNADNNEDYSPEELNQRRLAQLTAAKIDPNSPRGQSYLLNGTDSGDDTRKPVPIETLSGTKFMVRNKEGGYSLIDPSTMGGPPQAQPGPSVQPQPNAAQPPDGQPAPPVQPAGQPTAQPQANDIEAIDPQTSRREGYLQSLDPMLQNYIKKVADYEIDPRTTSVKGGMREKLLSAVAKYDPTYNQNTFGERSKAYKDFGTGPQGNIVRSFDVAIDHLDTLDKAAKAMQNGDLRLVNEIRNKWREQTGSDLPTNFKALVPIVSGEIAKAVVGSNNALADREELRAGLVNSGSPDQLSGAIGGYKALMSGQLKGLKKQYEETTGRKDFDNRIRESTLKVLTGEGQKTGPVKVDGYTITEH